MHVKRFAVPPSLLATILLATIGADAKSGDTSKSLALASRILVDPPCGEHLARREAPLDEGRSVRDDRRPYAGLFPFQVHLTMIPVEGEQYYCNGVLIDHEYVLTTAYCLLVNDRLKKLVTLGDIYVSGIGRLKSNGGTVYRASNYAIHELLNVSRLDEDLGPSSIDPFNVAIVKLRSHITFAKQPNITAVNRVCLPETNASYSKYFRVWMTGWNMSSDESQRLMYRSLVLHDELSCAASLNKGTGIYSNLGLCSLDQRYSAMASSFGQQGAAVVRWKESRPRQWELVGLHTGPAEVNCTYADGSRPQYFSQITHYIGWIRKAIEWLDNADDGVKLEKTSLRSRLHTPPPFAVDIWGRK